MLIRDHGTDHLLLTTTYLMRVSSAAMVRQQYPTLHSYSYYYYLMGVSSADIVR